MKNTIQPADVEWAMTWGADYPDKPETEMVFENDMALAHLLMNGVLFTNSMWWEKDCPEHIQRSISVAVCCNDTFAYACADAEPLPESEIENLYRMWAKDETYGPIAWCIKQRKQLPIKPVADDMRNAGLWDIDELAKVQ